jgi:hypothetical protein
VGLAGFEGIRKWKSYMFLTDHISKYRWTILSIESEAHFHTLR